MLNILDRLAQETKFSEIVTLNPNFILSRLPARWGSKLVILTREDKSPEVRYLAALALAKYFPKDYGTLVIPILESAVRNKEFSESAGDYLDKIRRGFG